MQVGARKRIKADNSFVSSDDMYMQELLEIM